MGSIKKKPVVELVAHTQLSAAGISHYLSATGNEDFDKSIGEAFDAGLSGMEVLVSMMAKLCYKSFTLGHNSNITRVRDIRSNIEAAIKSGHGSVLEHASMSFIVRDCSRIFTHELVRHRAGTAFCLSGDTEVWSGSTCNKRWNGVKKMWTLKQLHDWSLDKKRCGRLKLMMVRCFDGDEFVSARIKSVCKSGMKEVFKVTLENGRTIKASKDHRFMKNVDGSESWSPLSDLKVGDELATNGIKIDVPSVDVLRNMYLDQDMTRDQIAVHFCVSEGLVGKWVKAYGLSKPEAGRFKKGQTPSNKGLVGQFTYSHSDSAKQRLSESKRGCRNPQWKDGLSVKKKNARKIRGMICEVCGSCENIHGHHKDRDHSNDSAENIATLCGSCHSKLHQNEDGNGNALVIRWSKITSIESFGEEMTYDLEVDHPAHNFVANGIVTHNSQNSGRYIRLDAIDIVVDPILQPVEEDIREITAYLEAKYAVMAEKLGMNTDGLDFNRKKKLTSALRRIAPNGQTNEIGFSLNLRALRFVIQKRTDAAAEWEIRHVFAQVYEIANELVPTLFCDEVVTLVDGLPMVQFNHQT